MPSYFCGRHRISHTSRTCPKCSAHKLVQSPRHNQKLNRKLIYNSAKWKRFRKAIFEARSLGNPPKVCCQKCNHWLLSKEAILHHTHGEVQDILEATGNPNDWRIWSEQCVEFVCQSCHPRMRHGSLHRYGPASTFAAYLRGQVPLPGSYALGSAYYEGAE